MNAGLAAECVDDEAAVVGESRAAGGLRRGHRLDVCILGEGLAGFRRFREAKLASRLRFDAVGRQQLAQFGELAGIMRGDDDGAGELAAHITAIFCRLTSFSMPLRASANSAWNWSSLNGVFSAVAWISTILPTPVMTKLASVSASESSA